MKKIMACFLVFFGAIMALQAQITVTSPATGVTWNMNSAYTISWTWPGKINNPVLIRLFHEDIKVMDIAQGVVGGSYAWTVPNTLTAGTYAIRVREVQGTEVGISKPFTISPPLTYQKEKGARPDFFLNENTKGKLMGVNRTRPDPAVTQLAYQKLKIISQSGVNLKIIGTVKNISPTEFKYSGTAMLFRGSKLEVQKDFGILAGQQSFQVEFSVSEYYHPLSQGGPVYAENFRLKIVFPPGIQAKPEDVDRDLGNNEKELLGLAIAKDVYETYATDYRQQLAALINQHRQGSGLKALVLDACISNAAQGHSEWMVANNVFSHVGKNGSGEATRCQWAGCSCCAENIYQGLDTPSGAFNAWKASPGHNANMLGGYTKIGIGVHGGWITLDFE